MKDAKATRQRIEDVAMKLFVEKGVTETTTRDIARAAEVAEGTLYRHFESKEDLVWSMFRQHYADFAHRLNDLQAAKPDFRTKLDAMVRGFCALYDADPVKFTFLMIVQHQHLRRVARDDDNPIEVVSRIIAEAMDRGEIPKSDAQLVSGMMLGVVLRPAIFIAYGRLKPPMAALADDISAACWRVVNS
ncbi:MAG: TetR/AcrR family transcriptional regulator [Alphaproteobacteria bacterium]|nr:TetR/AcrR family transcriptional regulator [Alphaproteobacteria bacterium]